MFDWFRKDERKEERILAGDLDLLRKKVYYIRFRGKEWKAPALTVRQYAEFCQLLRDIEIAGSVRDDSMLKKTEANYERIVALALPSFPLRLYKKLSMEEATALVLAITSCHGVKQEKKN